MIYNLDDIPEDRMIKTHRVIPYTPEQIFDVFRDPDLLAKWWGPKGFTNTFELFEFQEGGMWRFTMHSPDRKDYPNESQFLRIDEPALIVFNHTCAPLFQTHLSFISHQDSCQIDWCMVFEDAKTCGNVVKFAKDGNEQNLNRMVALLKDFED